MKVIFEETVMQAQRLLTEVLREYVATQTGKVSVSAEWISGGVDDEYEHYIFRALYINSGVLMVEYSYSYRGEEERITEPFQDMNLDMQYVILKGAIIY